MKKIIKIEGMSCGHCKKRVEDALGALDGVSAKVNLEKKYAEINYDGIVSDEKLFFAVKEAGFEPVSIEEKKGLFGK